MYERGGGMKVFLNILFVATYLLIGSVQAAEPTGEQLKTSEQITKDLIVTGTRGISVQPKQEQVLQTEVMTTQDLAGTPREQSQGRVDMYIQFEYAKSSLTASSKLQLQELAKAMEDSRLVNDSFLIAGHTDALGGDQYNMVLSEKRSKSVVEYLSNTLHIDSKRLIAQGFGERFPKDKARPDSGVNRRVEVVNTRVLN